MVAREIYVAKTEKAAYCRKIINKIIFNILGFNKNEYFRNLKGRAVVSAPSKGEMTVTIERPEDADRGWYLCVFNTINGVGKTGPLHLTRKTGKCLISLIPLTGSAKRDHFILQGEKVNV